MKQGGKTNQDTDSGFNPSSAKVLLAEGFTSRFVLEDGSGRLAMKKKSPTANHATPRLWRSAGAAAAALAAMADLKEQQSKARHQRKP